MKSKRALRGGRADDRRRKHRSRPVPKWLESTQGLDAMARSRCLMVLSVLSGEKPVTDAITEAKISRGTYYQMETRALNAMLGALNPLAGNGEGKKAHPSVAQIEELQERVARLEREKRRTQRLLLLTRKAVRAPLTTGRRGRLPKKALQVAHSTSTRVGETAS